MLAWIDHREVGRGFARRGRRVGRSGRHGEGWMRLGWWWKGRKMDLGGKEGLNHPGASLSGPIYCPGDVRPWSEKEFAKKARVLAEIRPYISHFCTVLTRFWTVLHPNISTCCNYAPK